MNYMQILKDINTTEWIGIIVFIGCMLYASTAFFNKK